MKALRGRRFGVAAAMTSVAALSLAGGSLAALTDSAAAPRQVLTTGTVNVDTTVGGNWNQNLSNLAVGDTADRAATLTNTSTLPIGTATVTAKVVDTTGEFGGKLSDAVTVTVTEGTGAAAITIVSGVRLADFTGGYTMTFPGGLAPATDAPLNFHYVVAGARTTDTGSRTVGVRSTTANPDNKFQGSSLSVTYTVNAVQRAGNGIANAPTVAPTVSNIGSSSVTVSYVQPTSNPAGTTYRVTAVQDPTKTATGTATSLTVSGLASQKTYTFTVQAIAPSGALSAASPASAAITTLPPVSYVVPTVSSGFATVLITQPDHTSYVWSSYTPNKTGNHDYYVNYGVAPLIGYVNLAFYRVNANGSLTYLDGRTALGCCGDSLIYMTVGTTYLISSQNADTGTASGTFKFNLS